MTQILALMTQEYVLVASDRRLTYASGSSVGKVAHDNTCKLVSLCGIWGIAYTGLARLNNQPTHEWIAIKLAENNCKSASQAAEIIANHAAPAVAAARLSTEQTFLIAGWRRIDQETMAPHFFLITNMIDNAGAKREAPSVEFGRFERLLKPQETYAARIVGRPLQPGRGRHLDRLVRKVASRKLTPRIPMYALSREIGNTAASDRTVGGSVLAFCIPRAAAARSYKTGQTMILAKEPDLESASFCYLNPSLNELRQYGPTFSCGNSAVTDVETQNDPSRDFQSAQVRILYMPKKT
jgi:hypothetical protein